MQSTCTFLHHKSKSYHLSVILCDTMNKKQNRSTRPSSWMNFGSSFERLSGWIDKQIEMPLFVNVLCRPFPMVLSPLPLHILHNRPLSPSPLVCLLCNCCKIAFLLPRQRAHNPSGETDDSVVFQ